MKVKLKLIASLKIWVVIYPALTLSLYLFQEPLATVPVYLRTFFLTAALVPLIVFIGVPFVDFVVRLLIPKSNGNKY